MGQLSHNLSIQHFSHPHALQLSNAETTETTAPRAALTPSICAACKLPSSGWMYTCKQCIIASFTLHASCSQLPNLITHPSHTKHPLTLLPKPAYPGGSFYCDACGRQGDGFSYHCSECDFDVHSTCASKPLSLSHHMHCHQLQMEFFPPYNTKGFSCDICRSTGANHWLYRCAYCEFDAHIDCATSSAQTQTQTQTQIQAQTQRPQAQAMQQQWSQQVQNQAQPQVPTWPQHQVQTWPQQQQQGQTWPQQQPQGQTWPQQQQQGQTWPQQQQQVQTWQQQQQQGQTWQQQQQLQAQPQVQQQVQTWPQQQQQVQAAQPQLQVPQNYPQSGGVNQYQYQNTAVVNNNNQPQGMMNYNMPNPSMGPVQNQQNGQPGQATNNSLASQAYQSFVNAAADQAGQMLVQNLSGGAGGGAGGGNDGSSGSGDNSGNDANASSSDNSGGSSFFNSIIGGSGDGHSGSCDLD